MQYHRHRISDIFTLQSVLDGLSAAASATNLAYNAATRLLT